MENPYSTRTLIAEPRQSVGLALFQRLAAVLLFSAGWVCIGILFSNGLKFIQPVPLAIDSPEELLTPLQSFQRFTTYYLFTAFVFLSFPVSLLTWFGLKCYGIGKTRWLSVAIGLALAPVLIWFSWLLFGSLLFR